MNKIFVLIVSIMLMQAGLAFAHPPTSIDASYSAEEEMLTLEFVHGVNDIQQHYIKTLRISQKGKEDINIYSQRQDALKGFIENIPLKAEPGEEITIEAFCEDRGRKKVTFIIPQEELNKVQVP